MAELKLIANKAEAKSLSASLMDDVMRHAGVSLDKMMGERLTKLKAIDEEVTEIKTKQMMDEDDIAKLRNENIMS